MSMITLNSENFEKEVLQAKEPVLVEFQASWCGPCRALAPVVEALSEENKNIKFGKVDVDDDAELAGEFRVMSVPTLMLFRNGMPRERSVGVQKKEDILKMIQ